MRRKAELPLKLENILGNPPALQYECEAYLEKSAKICTAVRPYVSHTIKLTQIGFQLETVICVSIQRYLF